MVKHRSVGLASGDGKARALATTGWSFGDEEAAVRGHGAHCVGEEVGNAVGGYNLGRQRAVGAQEATLVGDVAERFGQGRARIGVAPSGRPRVAGDRSEDAKAPRGRYGTHDGVTNEWVGEIMVVATYLGVDVDDGCSVQCGHVRGNAAVTRGSGAKVNVVRAGYGNAERVVGDCLAGVVAETLGRTPAVGLIT